MNPTTFPRRFLSRQLRHDSYNNQNCTIIIQYNTILNIRNHGLYTSSSSSISSKRVPKYNKRPLPYTIFPLEIESFIVLVIKPSARRVRDVTSWKEAATGQRSGSPGGRRSTQCKKNRASCRRRVSGSVRFTGNAAAFNFRCDSGCARARVRCCGGPRCDGELARRVTAVGSFFSWVRRDQSQI